MMATAVLPSAWLSGPDAARLLGISARAVRRLAERGQLTALEVPNCHPRYSRDDVEALRDASIRPARRGA